MTETMPGSTVLVVMVISHFLGDGYLSKHLLGTLAQ
ncbi:enoyl-CoA hydratase [Mycobacterium sp. CBMA293]|uniref:Enoyl-CoA hydratase n=3 Tax=Mycolicibacterium TaxID=1866885 RepID=A0A8H2JI91_MYCMU|nr:enoyl-CoA hydratase [Mycolicibacterium sp. CBMA 360]MUL58719.1 enoyl-CoA hydratase [Mycolicibacterium sp. CBMA 335]MUL69113.1 enoyl-CoA hydratase [Mycolicibacterium sp. CBMA 311]MUL79593.1 enoyl-CoA hydratase [Mycolicibacterium sp. CBMA 226]MUL94077.1 enoyl-CoA hydratase [Mycolicibacterium sp. CBMA 230]MUM11206.1 enoyl-CoA hydratase [Mycolicibacterium sp. CBMA 293]MUM33500.1 enoyl-CoA hydratase [Mycolicibacterium sp. CBMA 361]RUP31846.1 MAG: enoyl-CoA hydratase [Mycolicibacterium sp.]TDK